MRKGFTCLPRFRLVIILKLFMLYCDFKSLCKMQGGFFYAFILYLEVNSFAK